MTIQDYLDKHTIVKIGSTPPGFVCTEVIVAEPKEFVAIVLQNGCYIVEIQWWDRSKIGAGSTIGYGGPRDPRSPDSYFFAETDIQKHFDAPMQIDEYYSYLDETAEYYSDFEIFPAFDVVEICSIS